MVIRKTMMAVLVVTLILSTAIPSFAVNILAFKQRLPTVRIASGYCSWVQCGTLQVNVPEDGYVVMTASGMAYFESYDPSSLILTLSTARAAVGPWKFTLSPGLTPYQTYNLQMVFSVRKGLRTFYLNGASCDGDGQAVGVQTGSFTAEFYPKSSVQPGSTVAAPNAVPGGEPSNIRINDAF